MAFVNEFPSEEDIDKYNLVNYKKNKDLPLEYRRTWTVDHAKNCYICGGLSGNPAFGEEIKGKFSLYINGQKFLVKLIPGESSLVFTDNPYRVKWDAVEDISAIRSDHYARLPNSAWLNPDVSQPVLDGMSLNSFLKILRDALSIHGEGDTNRNIHNPIVVQFGF